MNPEQTICPYTGLRSFTEEESLYFKGRDLQVDQITALLEQNKFLMVTGASGEGKSSLIYAGLVPNARAGFFKARYTNWVVADFRPERSPVKNMAKAVADKFNRQPATIETELRRGFSSLVDLYTNSEYYIDEQEDSWQALEETEKKNKRRQAANLMILVDQFEEFFTNPENFYNEAPSQDSQVVVNLILETARIAIKKNLPVYVVCTMRSDYIGQCSAFRGLPEYIGFSQFFVPRLKRKDLKQVVEEPAILSGNRISQRLIERLVYDLSEGVDQLPILQHALSQVWLAANHGGEEMDLIHYAMVGGMPADELPEQDQQTFSEWFEKLPAYKQKYFSDTGLSKVIEIHASMLYENAWEYYNHKHKERPITQQEAKRILSLTFCCLTKIDNSRAVRNRMSLEEITAIINSPGLPAEVVGEVISIYREEGNSFIRPFKSNEPSGQKLSSNTVLDITHESLIRNWNKLNEWANREFEFYSTYLDFKKQLDRWKDSGKSRDFLLPIGPLAYFENWYVKCKPNAGWIRRYSEIDEDKNKSLAKANTVLSDIQDFLKRSAGKVKITRAFMKYGPQRIATLFAIFIMLVLSGFYWFDAEQKQNNQVIKKARMQAFELMKSIEVGNNFKATYLLLEERYESGALVPYLKNLNDKDRLSLSIEVYKQLLLFNKHDKSKVKDELTTVIGNNFSTMMGGQSDYAFLLIELNKFTTLLTYDNYYNPSPKSEVMIREMLDEGYRLCEKFFSDTKLFQATIPSEINYTIQQWLTLGNVTEEKIQKLLSMVSPFGNSESISVFKVYYPQGSYEINGRIPNDFNGGYHTVASLYAAVGDVDNVVNCFDQLRQSGQNDYFTGSLFNNYNNILSIFYKFGQVGKIGKMIQWIGLNYPSNTPLTIYRNSVIRAGYISHLYRVNIQKGILRSYQGYFFPNLCLVDREVFAAITDEYDRLIQEIKDPSERNYTRAINKKRRAMYVHKYSYDRGFKQDMDFLESTLQEAVNSFKLVDKAYLEEAISVTLPYYGDGVRTRNYKRKHLFLYPDYMEGWFSWTYHSDIFFNYLATKDLFTTLYSTPEDFDYLHLWIAKAFELKPFIGGKTFDNYYPISDQVLQRILEIADKHPAAKTFDRNLIHLILANRSFAAGNREAGMNYYAAFDKENFSGSRDKYEYLEKTFFLNQLKDLSINLAKAGYSEEAMDLAEKFEQDHEKAYAYMFMAERVYMDRADPATFIYLDSVFAKLKEVDFSRFNFGPEQAIEPRYNLILLLSRIGGRDLAAISDEYLREIIEGNKFGAVISKVQGVAEEGNFYRALIGIPDTFTESQDLIARALILLQACRKKESTAEANQWASMDLFFNHDTYYIFYLPS